MKTKAEAAINAAAFAIISLLASVLLFVRLDAKSFWADELYTWTLAGHSPVTILSDVAADLHPPLYFILIHYWSLLVGQGEFALRYFSVAVSLLALSTIFALGRRLWDGRIGLAATLLTTLSPFFLLYSRMARYYSLTLLLALLSVLAFLKLLSKPTRFHWALYVIVGALLLYTDYPAASALITQNLLVLLLYFLRRRPGGWDWFRISGFAFPKGDVGNTLFKWANPGFETPFFQQWILAQVAIVVLYLPWLGTAWRSVNAASVSGVADFARDWFGYVPKLAFPFYSFSVGETLFPWHPLAPFILVAFGVLAVTGYWLLMRNRPDSAVVLLAFLVLPLLFTTFIVSFISTATTFLNIPSRTMFAFPFFILIVSAGILYRRDVRIQMVATIVIVLGSAVSLANYHLGLQMFNPIYAVPMKEIVQDVSAQARPGDVFVSEGDTGFGHYYRQAANSPPYFQADSNEAVRFLQTEKSARVWLVSFGRDRTRLADNTLPELKDLLARDYRLEGSRGYVEQDPTYRKVKEFLLGRPAYQYKVLVELYVRR